MPNDEKIQTIVEVSSNTYGGCKMCTFAAPHLGDVPLMVNHYLQVHGFELLHVGQQTERGGDDGSPFHTTVAVLGTTQVIKERAPGRLSLPEKEREDA